MTNKITEKASSYMPICPAFKLPQTHKPYGAKPWWVKNTGFQSDSPLSSYFDLIWQGGRANYNGNTTINTSRMDTNSQSGLQIWPASMGWLTKEHQRDRYKKPLSVYLAHKALETAVRWIAQHVECIYGSRWHKQTHTHTHTHTHSYTHT